MFVTFIVIIETGLGLGWAGSDLIYDSLEMSQIASIYVVFVKSSRELICDAQYMTLSQNITDACL
jgi:hypothetical protein